MSDITDFKQHRERAMREYSEVRDKYVRYTIAIESILKMALKKIPNHNISVRAKELTSFTDKASKADENDSSRPKYNNPLSEITDMAGARVIAYALRHVKDIEDAILREFVKIDRLDKADHLEKNATVGYRSIHLIVQMTKERSDLLEYREFDGLFAEVQIRTILQHAWAEIEHDMQYKGNAEQDKELRQRFAELAGMIQIGDREFDQVFEIHSRKQRQIQDLSSVVKPEVESHELMSSISEVQLPKSDHENPIQSDVKSESISLRPKELMENKRYSEAIIAYSKLIEKEPEQYTHLVGRAMARYQSGDIDGAIRDIEISEQLKPGNTYSRRLKSIIGIDEVYNNRINPEDAAREGHRALRSGKIEMAIDKYTLAEENGYNPVYSIFNKAMVLFLSREFTLARRELDKIDPYSGSIVEFHIYVLSVMCYLMLNGVDQEKYIKDTKVRAQNLNYQYDIRSPLHSLEEGIAVVFNTDERKKTDIVFSILKNPV